MTPGDSVRYTRVGWHTRGGGVPEWVAYLCGWLGQSAAVPQRSRPRGTATLCTGHAEFSESHNVSGSWWAMPTLRLIRAFFQRAVAVAAKGGFGLVSGCRKAANRRISFRNPAERGGRCTVASPSFPAAGQHDCCVCAVESSHDRQLLTRTPLRIAPSDSAKRGKEYVAQHLTSR